MPNPTLTQEIGGQALTPLSVRREMLGFLNHMCNGGLVNKMAEYYRKLCRHKNKVNYDKAIFKTTST